MRRQHVTLTLADASRHEGTLFVAPGDEIEGLLERAPQFLPMQKDGALKLYARRAIAVVTLAAEGDADLAALLVRVKVVVRLVGGATLRGELRFVAESGNARPLDHLNAETQSFAVHDGARVHYVAKAHVEHVEESR